MTDIKIETCTYSIILLAVLFAPFNCLNITKLTVPKFVQNGTEESVILDCEYEYEKETDSKLVVKWFHNDDPNPVYQWIPEYDLIQSSEKFGDRINKEYEVMTGDDYTKHRALNILRPTTEFSGMYKCHVSSFASEVSRGEIMMVYAHPANVYLNYSVTDDDMVQIMCVVENVYPVPEIEMFQLGPGESEPTPVEEVHLHHIYEDDAYDVVLSTNMTEEELATETLRYFECVVSIPGTTYVEKKRVPYFPAARNDERVGSKDMTEDAAEKANPAIFSFCFLILLQMLRLLC